MARLATASKRFVSYYRGAMMLCTCLGILAVDFRAFPRRFAKVETFGTGLMDAGVGSFVFASGLLSEVGGRRQAHGHRSRWSSLCTALRSMLPLLVLGAIRLVITKAAAYQEHVGEYGLHWNFFFTLAAITLLHRLVQLPPRWLLFSGSFLLMVHELLLKRPQEGRCCSLQKDLEQWHEGSQLRRLWDWLLRLASLTAAMWLVFSASLASADPVSRRACNASYVLWMLAYNMLMLLLFAAAEVLAPNAQDSSLLQALNSHMLPVFLLANVLTGAINMSIDTLAVGDWAARGIVALYMLVLCGGAVAADARGIRLKFW
ncbi:hypothetical protein WJX72_000961 [[Myrmecia] bisecta]|uniref:GPI-anchored wall transfer protein 1 n=1 Tax=[Myrmecia] bisecta TaxID=41462 RepID=A0AAW1QE57_9CHLO